MAMHELDTLDEERILRFGRFELHPRQRLLLDSGKPLPIGARALDILLVLVASAGKIVSKETIIAQVWPKTYVEEINLRVHISALRRTLGRCPQSRDYITNVRQRGYSFVAYVEQVSRTRDGLVVQPRPLLNVAERSARLEGRDGLIEEIAACLRTQRQLSLIGPAGVGKTCVALRVAHQQLGQFRDGVRFVDLATLSDPAQLADKVATDLGLALPAGLQVSREQLFSALAERHMLVVLDNCEHLIDACAALCEDMLQAAPALSLLATSREALRTEREHVLTLAPLDTPPLGSSLGLAGVLRYPAIKLFLRRARARQADFWLHESDVPQLVELCRRLDGLPLAIELAASQMDSQSLEGVVAQLDNHSYLSLLGRRSALARHSSLMAALQWSYDLLGDNARECLHSLADCGEYFGVEDAKQALAACPISPSERCSAVSKLVSLSLIGLRRDGEQIYYHMFNSTRAFVLEKRRQIDLQHALADQARFLAI